MPTAFAVSKALTATTRAVSRGTERADRVVPFSSPHEFEDGSAAASVFDAPSTRFEASNQGWPEWIDVADTADEREVRP